MPDPDDAPAHTPTDAEKETLPGSRRSHSGEVVPADADAVGRHRRHATVVGDDPERAPEGDSSEADQP